MYRPRTQLAYKLYIRQHFSCHLGISNNNTTKLQELHCVCTQETVSCQRRKGLRRQRRVSVCRKLFPKSLIYVMF